MWKQLKQIINCETVHFFPHLRRKYWCKMIFHLQYKKGRNKKNKTKTTHTLSTILICLRCNKSLSVWIFMITYCQIKTIRPISSIRIDRMKKKIWKLFFSADNNILQKYAHRVRHFLATTGFKVETWTLQKHPLYSYQLTYLFSGTIRTTSCLNPVCKMQSLTLSDMSAMWNRIPHAVKNNIQYNINYTRSNQQKQRKSAGWISLIGNDSRRFYFEFLFQVNITTGKNKHCTSQHHCINR